MPFFRADPGIRAGGIDQRNHRHRKFFREPHQAERFAITFGMRAAEIAQHVFLGVASFLVGDENAALRPEHGDAARHRFVVRKKPVAAQLDPVGETTLDVIERERPLHMPRDLHPLPRRQVAVNLPPRFADLRLNRLHRRVQIDIVFVGVSFQILQPLL